MLLPFAGMIGSRLRTVDEHFANVSLLLHMNGANAGTTFTDSSSNAHTMTVNGNAQTSTAQYKFSGSSGLFDGTGDFLSLSNEADLAMGTGNYTIEFFYYVVGNYVSGGTNCYLFDIGSNGLRVQLAANQLFFHNEGLEFQIVGGAGVGVSTGVWRHFAGTRNGSTVTAWLDGVSIGTDTTVKNQTTDDIRICEAGDGGFAFNGYMAEFRLTKGVCRYTASFAPPVVPFPNQ